MATSQQAGAGSGFNLKWDGSWQVRARTGDFGWSAEFAVPFRTLRYRERGAQVWGLNFQRNMPLGVRDRSLTLKFSRLIDVLD